MRIGIRAVAALLLLSLAGCCSVPEERNSDVAFAREGATPESLRLDLLEVLRECMSDSKLSGHLHYVLLNGTRVVTFDPVAVEEVCLHMSKRGYSRVPADSVEEWKIWHTDVNPPLRIDLDR